MLAGSSKSASATFSPNVSTRSLKAVDISSSPSSSSPVSASNCTNACTLAVNNLKENNVPEYHVADWTIADVELWARRSEHFSKEVVYCLRTEEIDGRVLLALCENDVRDMRYRLNYQLSFGDLKKLWLSVRGLQERHNVAKTTAQNGSGHASCVPNCNHAFAYSSAPAGHHADTSLLHRQHTETSCHHLEAREIHSCGCLLLTSEYVPNVPNSGDSDAITPPMSVDGRAVNIPTEFFKTFISLGYSFLVTWITSFVMVIVHERVPDMKRYPPLPDIFLDNVPHIPWAFHMCEITGTLLFAIWSCVCVFHKYRMVLLRRFFALAGTVFLLRCVTMLITSLSVPGTHLQCDQSDYAVDDTDLTLTEALELRISRAYTIWSGLGMSIQGVRTCGDYMFSGHTVALTLLNFFITEYTPRNLYFLHTLTWLLNMFGIFFILAAHEHYSIDVFVAFYITSRLFLYYHTLANNQALMSRDSTRTRIWFPMFSYFENSVDGIIPNEFDTVSSLLNSMLHGLMEIKDTIMMTAQRFTVDPPQLAMATKNLLLIPTSKQHRHVATSTHSANIGLSVSTNQLPEEQHTLLPDNVEDDGSVVDAANADADVQASTDSHVLRSNNSNSNESIKTIKILMSVNNNDDKISTTSAVQTNSTSPAISTQTEVEEAATITVNEAKKYL